MNLQALEQKHKELGEEIERLKSKGRWKPEYGDEYFLPFDFAEAYDVTWEDDSQDEFLYLTRNVFRTKEEAEQARKDKLEYYAVLDELERISGGKDGQVALMHDNGKWKHYSTFGSSVHSNWPTFEANYQAQKAIDTLGSRLNVLLRVV